MELVQTGKGGNSQGNGNIVEISTMFGNTVPANVTQDPESGLNNLRSATLAVMGIPYLRYNFNRSLILDFEEEL